MIGILAIGIGALWFVVFEPIEQKIAKFVVSHPIELVRPVRLEKVAIVVPCYKHSQFLKTMMRSIVEQTYRPIEAIFVNDASPDSTQQVLEENAGEILKDIPFRIFTMPENVGQSDAINIAVKTIDAEAITILNDDDYLMHDCVELAIKTLNNYPSLYMVGAGQLNFVDDSQISWTHATEIRDREIYVEVLNPENVQWAVRFIKDLRLNHSGLTFTRAAWEAVGGYYSNKSQRVWRSSDLDFELRVSALFPIGHLYYGNSGGTILQESSVPLSYWRHGYSVDAGVWS